MGKTTLFAAVVCSGLVVTSLQAQLVSLSDGTPQISVTGFGRVDVQPDLATVLLGVYAADRDLPRAKAAADASVRRLLQLTESLSIASADVVSSGLNVSANYSSDTKPQFLGYEVSRSVTVIVRNLELLDQLIDRAIQAGANREFDVTLTASREREHREHAMDLAVEDAKAQASRLATGFGVRLGQVRSVRTSADGATRAFATGRMVTQGAGTFRHGTLRFESTLTVSFALQTSQ